MTRSFHASPSTAFAGAALALGIAVTGLAAAPAHAAGGLWYEVTITNVTYAQRFTPFLLSTHAPSVHLFVPGAPASAGLATLAEQGNVDPLRQVLDGDARVNMTAASSGLLEPGASVTVRVQALPQRDRLSLAAMLIPTNDAFVALDAVEIPYFGAAHYTAVAYDAGSEVNDERCASIPGPDFSECGGPGGGGAPGNGEGFVHVHRGMHGVGDFDPARRAWSNPVARIRIERVN